VLDWVDNVCTTFGGHRPLNIWDSEDLQNLAQFKTTFEFDREYLWTGWRCQQAVNDLINRSPSCVEQKIGELWSTNTRDHVANVYLP